MSQAKLVLIYVLCLVFGPLSLPAVAQNCSLAGAPSWSEPLKTILADCNNSIVSPNGRLILRIDSAGVVQVLDKTSGKVIAGVLREVEPPALAAWSPNSNAFFIDNGGGSGETSELRLYALKNGTITETESVHHSAVSLYRQRTKCVSDALDPDVWGLRWTPDGQYLDLLVSATVHQPCGQVGSFLGVRVRASDAKVSEVLSERATVAQWSAWLPKGLKSHESGSTP